MCFLVQLTDGGGRDLAAPESLGDVLHTPVGYAGQVHLDESLFYTAFPAAIPLNNGGFKGDSFKLRHLECDIPGSGGEVAVVLATAITWIDPEQNIQFSVDANLSENDILHVAESVSLVK